MPSLMLRNLPAELVGRLRAYARSLSLSVPEAAADLIDAGLREKAAGRAGGLARAATLTAEERRTIARRAAKARWQTHQP